MKLKRIEDETLQLPDEGERNWRKNSCSVSRQTRLKLRKTGWWRRNAGRVSWTRECSACLDGRGQAQGAGVVAVIYLLHPAAEVDHLESIGYFESKCPGLGAS